MGKKLLIIRHGKAENAGFGEQDVQRALTKKGETDAIAVAEKLLQRNIVPELLVSSNAKRAHKTALLFAGTWNMPVDSINIQPAIYEASRQRLQNIVERLDNNYDFIAIFGHNPGFTELVNEFTDANLTDLATSGAALVEFEVNDWVLTAAGGTLALLIEP